MAFSKTPTEKLRTKLNKLTREQAISEHNGQILVRNKVLLKFSNRNISYTKTRYYPSKVDDLIEENFTVSIPLNHDNLKILGSNPINPPFGARKIIDLFRSVSTTNFTSIVIGTSENKISGSKIYLTKEVYDTILNIDKEEGKDKRVRFTNRLIPFLNTDFNLNIAHTETSRDYSILLKEIIASGELTQADLVAMSKQLESGEINNVVIKKQVNKQVKWLIETIEEIIDVTELTKPKAKELGSSHFGYSKISITGPEHLMEKILSQYGQYTLFGVPALLNTDKYVTKEGLSRSQFDIILINHLGDIEVVELKRPDQYILEYDQNRGKFYPSKDLAIAISQSERYISAVNKDNDEEYKIDGKKIREYINDQVGGTMYVESVRPTALIIIGSWKTAFKDYSTLRAETRRKVKEHEYNDNGHLAYKEIKNSFKNIKLLNYSELLDHARTRLELMKNEE